MEKKQNIDAEDCISVSPAKNCCIILTAPHGGKQSFHPTLFVERTQGKKLKKLSDLYTAEMLKEIESKVYELSNGRVKPYTICLKVHRKYIDANRNKNEYPYQISEDNSFGEKVYNLYHEKIDKAIHEIESIYGKGTAILIDIHGQAQMNNFLMIGNKNGKTCGYEYEAKEDNNCNKNIVYNIISYAFKDKDINIHGWNEMQQKLNGGFTVQKYSGYINNMFKRIAIQFEFGKTLRQNRDHIVHLLSLGLYQISIINKQLEFGNLKYRIISLNDNQEFVQCTQLESNNDFPNNVYLSRSQVEFLTSV